MKYLVARMICLAATISFAFSIFAQEVKLTLDATKTTGRVEETVYGHFLEHIYHSCNGGLWGELI